MLAPSGPAPLAPELLAQLGRMEKKLEEGFRTNTELTDCLLQKQSSLESTLDQRRSTVQEVTRLFDTAINRLEEQLLQRQSSLEKTLDARQASLDEVASRLETALAHFEAKLENRLARAEGRTEETLNRHQTEVQETFRLERLEKQEMWGHLGPLLEDSSHQITKHLDEGFTFMSERMEKNADALRKMVQADLTTIAGRCELMTDALRRRAEAEAERGVAPRQGLLEGSSDGDQLHELRVTLDGGVQFLADRLLVLHRELMEIYSAISLKEESSQHRQFTQSGMAFGASPSAARNGQVMPATAALAMPAMRGAPVGYQGSHDPGTFGPGSGAQYQNAPQAVQRHQGTFPTPFQCETWEMPQPQHAGPQHVPQQVQHAGPALSGDLHGQHGQHGQGQLQQGPSFDQSLDGSGDESTPSLSGHFEAAVHDDARPGAPRSSARGEHSEQTLTPVSAAAARTAMELEQRLQEHSQARAPRPPGTRRRPNTAGHDLRPQVKVAVRRPHTAGREQRRQPDGFMEERQSDWRRSLPRQMQR